MSEGFYYDVLDPPVWSEQDGRHYPYRLAGEWVEETAITGLDVKFPTDEPFVHLHKDGRLVLSAGYLWDGPSGVAIDTADFMRASAVHDGLYQLEKKWGVRIRKLADQELSRISKEDGMSAFRRFYCWLAVRLFGGLWNKV